MRTASYREQVAAEVRAEVARQNRRMRDVAAEADIAVSTLSRKLNAVGAFNVEELGRIASVLGKQVSDFLPALNVRATVANSARVIAEGLAEAHREGRIILPPAPRK